MIGPLEIPAGDRQHLLSIARSAISEAVSGQGYTVLPPGKPPLAQVPPLFSVSGGRPAWESEYQGGAFVTVTVDGKLRGCIGALRPKQSIECTVRECAAEAATNDRRFAAVLPEELPGCVIEISILTSPAAVRDPADITAGRHGLIVSAHGRKGLLLPQVALEHEWDAETFLSQTCRKAGLPEDEWRRTASIESFEATVFRESY